MNRRETFERVVRLMCHRDGRIISHTPRWGSAVIHGFGEDDWHPCGANVIISFKEAQKLLMEMERVISGKDWGAWMKEAMKNKRG